MTLEDIAFIVRECAAGAVALFCGGVIVAVCVVLA